MKGFLLVVFGFLEFRLFIHLYTERDLGYSGPGSYRSAKHGGKDPRRGIPLQGEKEHPEGHRSKRGQSFNPTKNTKERQGTRRPRALKALCAVNSILDHLTCLPGH